MAMTQASGTASPAPESDRLRRTSLTSRLLGRPSAGALLITLFVWIVFAVLSLSDRPPRPCSRPAFSGVPAGLD